jgi:hypothetical protein
MSALLRLATLAERMGRELRLNSTELAIVDPTRLRSCDVQLDHRGDLEQAAEDILEILSSDAA